MKLHYFAANLSVVILKGNVNTLFKSYILVVCMPSIFFIKNLVLVHMDNKHPFSRLTVLPPNCVNWNLT